MAFKFGASQIEFGFKDKEYTLLINARLAVDLEKTLGIHPLTLAQRISKAVDKGETPPLGQMAELFEFMLKRAGARDIDFDDVYGELFGGSNAEKVGVAVGELLTVFVPVEDKPDPK